MLTLVVPAAGRGSRLGDARPKALVELGGRPLVEWVVSAAHGLADRFVVVIRPADQPAFEEWAARAALPRGIDWAFQQEPEGSLAAVRIGIERAWELGGTESAIVIAWADQVGVSADTIRSVADAIVGGGRVLAAPLASAAYPYVWVEVDPSGHIARVLRTRDGDVSPRNGLADLGVFGLSAPLAREYVGSGLSSADAMETREGDFTYALPALSLLADTTFLPRIADATQLVAINTAEDLSLAQKVLVGSDD